MWNGIRGFLVQTDAPVSFSFRDVPADHLKVRKGASGAPTFTYVPLGQSTTWTAKGQYGSSPIYADDGIAQMHEITVEPEGLKYLLVKFNWPSDPDLFGFYDIHPTTQVLFGFQEGFHIETVGYNRPDV